MNTPMTPPVQPVPTSEPTLSEVNEANIAQIMYQLECTNAGLIAATNKTYRDINDAVVADIVKTRGIGR